MRTSQTGRRRKGDGSEANEVEVADRIRQVLAWRAILLGDDEREKRVLIESLEGDDLVVALSTLDDLTDDELRLAARYDAA